MKRLSGWDAVLLYSETPNVHMHTLKLAVIDISDLKGRKFGIEEFRRSSTAGSTSSIRSAIELIDIPFKFHHPMWRENCEVDLDYHVRPYRVDSAGRTSPARRGGRQDRQHAAGPQPATVGDVLHRGPRQRPDRGAGQDPSRAGRRGGVGEPAGAGNGPAGRARRPTGIPTPPIPPRRRVSWCARRCADHVRQIGRLPGVMRYTAQGVQPGAQELTQAVTRADPAVHAAAVLHEPPVDRAAPVRHRDAGTRRRQGRPASTSA